MHSQNKELLCTYHYDPLDCLVGLNSAKPDALQRFYCKTRLATEIQGLARCSIVQQGDLLLAQQKRLGGTLETALLATDQQRSVMHTVGGFPLPIVYSPYGHRRAESGLTSLLGFNGERPDTVTGYYLLGNGNRAFNPSLMRFTSPDRLSPFGEGGLNPYAYCLGDPVNMSDPTGNIPGRVPWFKWTTRRVAEKSVHVRETGEALFPGTLIDSFMREPDFLWVPPLDEISTASRPPKGAKIFRDIKPLQQLAFEKLPRQQRTSAHPAVKRAIANVYDEHPLMNEAYTWVANASNSISDFRVHVYKQEDALKELKAGFDLVNGESRATKPNWYIANARRIRSGPF